MTPRFAAFAAADEERRLRCVEREIAPVESDELWIYDLRTNHHFTLKQNPLRREHLDDFVLCYKPEARNERTESPRFKRFSHDELLQREKVSLDITWLRDESLEDADNLPPPDVIAQEIVDDLEAALAEFVQIGESLRRDSSA